MKTYVIAMCMALVFAALTACSPRVISGEEDGNPVASAEPVEQANAAQSGVEDLIAFDGTVFTYNGQSYDIADRIPSVNAIMSCTAVGKNIVVEGHIDPKNGVYCIFNAETEEFDKDIFGNHLIWYDEDISTAVYSLWSDIYNYNGDVIAAVDRDEGSIIYELAFVEDHSKVQATIVTESGSEEQQLFDV